MVLSIVKFIVEFANTSVLPYPLYVNLVFISKVLFYQAADGSSPDFTHASIHADVMLPIL